ncbi:hypothetical protein, partial [Microcoleus sp. Aus8_D4]|uniref:hypothetical protein n=1 Tax=Microcoleus sp. Aus8_D4 TaxID=2818634 RepID=UPI002FCFC9C0
MINFARNLHLCADGGKNYWITSESVGVNLVNHLKAVAIGLTEIEYKILAAFAVMPSIFCTISPVVQLLGEAVSGKSQLLLAVAEISGQPVISGPSTGASLKNHINAIRWVDPSVMTYEKNCWLLMDNVNSSTF